MPPSTAHNNTKQAMMSSWRKLKKVQQSSSFSVTPAEQAFWFKLISVRLYENDVSVRSTCGGGLGGVQL